MNKATIFFLLFLSSLKLSARPALAVPEDQHPDNCLGAPDSSLLKDSVNSAIWRPKKGFHTDFTFKDINVLLENPNMVKTPVSAALIAGGQVQVINNKTGQSTLSVKAIKFKAPAVSKWTFRSLMYSVCDYLYKGIKSKYQPLGLLAANTR